MKKLLTICMMLPIMACNNNRSSLETHQQTARIDGQIVASYVPSESSSEEYVSRIGRKILLVSDRPDSNYNFKVMDSSDALLAINATTHSVIISQGALLQLKSEAQLAAALAFGLAKLNNVTNPDKEVAQTLVLAGYDPHAVLELQQQYFYAANHGKYYWLQTLYPNPPTAGTITSDELMLKKMPQGLSQGIEEYQKELNG